MQRLPKKLPKPQQSLTNIKKQRNMNTITKNKPFFDQKNYNFNLPKILECSTPSEERGIGRDEVKLMISNKYTNEIHHKKFKEIDAFLEEGDVLIVNTSGTMNAALSVELPNSKKGRLHLSTQIASDKHLVEIREVENNETKRFHDLEAGEQLQLEHGGKVKLIEPYYENKQDKSHIQLWVVEFDISQDLNSYLEKYGSHIKYFGVDKKYPTEYYQTCFVTEKGSTEMPSAGRAFTPNLITKLIAKGIQFAPILLHTGISSLEANEKPYPEYFSVSQASADVINNAKKNGNRIIAVGTTAIRAIESSLNEENKVIANEGLTDLFVTPERGLKVIDSMITGFHEPKASHLLMMEALVNREHLELCYQSAIKKEYKWHEFGDVHFIATANLALAPKTIKSYNANHHKNYVQKLVHK